VIVVDASALVAIFEQEPEGAVLLERLSRAGSATISPVNFVEAGLILVGRGRFEHQSEYADHLVQLEIVITDLPLGPDALAGYLAYGKGWHPARLNLADCFAYALAKALDAPLLYKGDDFAKTDVRSALQPT